MAARICPICRRKFQSDESPALPFCSQRCRQIDLGRWLGEGYSLPVEREEGDQSAAPDDEDS